MKRIVFAIALLLSFAGPSFSQGTASLASNPLAGSITATSSACATASSCVWMKMPPNTGSISVVVSGTFSATLIAEQSADSVNFTAASGTLVAGTTTYGVSGMTDFRVRASAYTSGQAQINIQASASAGVVTPSSGTGQIGSVAITNTPGSTDPCQNPSVLKSSAAVSISTATTTSIVAVSGTKAVYVCGGALTIAPSATTADTAVIEYGTGATCTSPTALTGALGNGDLTSAAPPIVVMLGYGGTSMTAPASNGVCILSAGTAVSINGWISFVQQ